MSVPLPLLRRFLADRSGATAIEYAVIAAGVGATLAAIVFTIGDTVLTSQFERVRDALIDGGGTGTGTGT